MKTFFTALLIMVLISPLFANPDPAVTLQTTTLTNPFPSTFVVNVAFTEPVTGFVPAVVNVTNGTVISITGTPCQFSYTMVIQPNDAGAVNVVIPAHAVVSLTTGAPNLASNPLIIPGAGPSPTVVLQTSTSTNPFPSTFVVNVAFNEPVGDFVAADVIVTNGAVVSTSGSACQMEYALVIQPNSMGPISIFIPANAVVSLTTGSPNLASNLLSIPGLNPNVPPASNFNLTSWSIVLPLPLGSQNNAISIGQATLNGTPGANNGYTNPPYFFTDPVTGAMNFFAPLNGATTTGSSFARSELIEILPGASAYWKLSTFASNELNASLLVTQVPPSKKIIIGQIGSKGNTDPLDYSAGSVPLLKLFYDMNPLDPNGSICDGCIYAQVRVAPAQSGFLKIVNLIKHIHLNTLFTYKITLLRDGTLTITANHLSTNIKVGTSTNNTIGWGAQQLYFGAGVVNWETGTSNILGSAASFFSVLVNHT